MHNLTGKATVPLETFGGLVTFCSPDSAPAGSSPRCHDVDFSIGGFATREGTRSALSFSNNSTPDTLGTNAVNISTVGNPWATPENAISTTLFASATINGGTDGLQVTEFAFNLSESTGVPGILLQFGGFANAGVTFRAQLVLEGAVIGEFMEAESPSSDQTISLGGPTATWGASLTPAIVNNTSFGVRITAYGDFSAATAFVNDVRLTIYEATDAANFQYLKTFTASNGDVKNLCMDANGEMFLENVTSAPGVLTPLFGGLPTSSYAKSITLNDREYIAFNDLVAGDDLPLQYTGDWTDRITQEGPGAPPVVTVIPETGDQYDISQITQPAAQTRGFSYYLKSSGPGSNSAGNVVTIYYSDSTLAGPDTDLVDAFNSGNPVYLYFSFTGAPTSIGPVTVLVTSIGLASPPSQPRKFYYFTYQDISTEYVFYPGSGHPAYSANYQRSLATMQMAEPVPGVTVNSNITITGNSQASYNSNWRIAQTLNSGALAISQSSLTAGTATFSYSVVSGVAPQVGELVAVTGLLNANGTLNGTNLTIEASSGTPTGTFQVSGYSAVTDYPALSENGQGVTAGTLFTFDPGELTLGTGTSPIYGTGTGGDVVFSSSAMTIGTGTRQAVVFFGTRNGAFTFTSPPIVFTVPSNTGALQFSLLPIGPPDVVLRGIAITEAGQNGIPGASFYALPNPALYSLNGVNHTSDSTFVRDNTTSTVTISFRDEDLLAGQAIDVQGNDLFNQIEIGNPGWITAYAGRLFYGLTQSKIQNLLNLSFDGGYISTSGPKIPLGWTYDPASNNGTAFGSLIVSPKFGDSYYIQNNSGSTQAVVGLISQSAFRDYYQVEILRPNVPYSVRFAARVPSGIKSGQLVIDLYSAGKVFGSAALDFTAMDTSLQQFSLALLTSTFTTVPSDLIFRVYGTNMGNGADVEIDRIQVFPTRQPVNNTRLLVSYVDNPEGVDAVTGAIDTSSENTQPCMGAVVMYDLLYLLKTGSMYYTQDSASDEPDQWGVHEVSNKAGAIGINAYDSGEEWIIMANRSGIYIFTGGEPRKISTEIQELWDAINWKAGGSIWVRNDVQKRRLYVGIPLPTPNFWLPDAAVNAAPEYPNVILMLAYTGQDSGEEISSAQPVFATQFGNLDTVDMRRKWTLWQIPSPYGEFLRTDAESLSAPLRLGNGIHNSKVYAVDATTDDGARIPMRYTTYGFGDSTDKGKYPLLGNGRVRWSYTIATMLGTGTTNLKATANKLDGPVQYSVPVALDSGSEDRERPLNIAGYRTFVEFTAGSDDNQVDISRLSMVGKKDTWNEIRGSE